LNTFTKKPQEIITAMLGKEPLVDPHTKQLVLRSSTDPAST
jgi:hypothetical protein